MLKKKKSTKIQKIYGLLDSIQTMEYRMNAMERRMNVFEEQLKIAVSALSEQTAILKSLVKQRRVEDDIGGMFPILARENLEQLEADLSQFNRHQFVSYFVLQMFRN